MKKRIVIILAAAMAAIGAFADTETVGGYTWTYTVYRNPATSAAVNSISPKPKGAVVIPSTLGGLPVTSIGCAFDQCSSLTSIALPSSITSIGDCAFRGCSSLTSIALPSSITSIGSYAFSGCSSLTSIALPSSITSIGDYAFKGCSSLISIALPNGLTKLSNSFYGAGYGAFSGCSSLANVSIPGSLTEIPGYAFNGCESLTAFAVADDNPSYKSLNGMLLTKDGGTLIKAVNGALTIPTSVTNISSYAFSSLNAITSFTVAAGNPAYKSVNGALLTKDGKALVRAVNGMTTVPSGVTSIEDGAFKGCNIRTFMVPESVTNLYLGAFSGCQQLEKLTVLTHSFYCYSDGSLSECPKLKTLLLPSYVDVDSAEITRYYDLGDYETSLYSEGDLELGSDGIFISGMPSLQCLVIPENVSWCGILLRQGSSLSAIQFPSTLWLVNVGGFGGLWNLDKVVFSGPVPSSLHYSGEGKLITQSGLFDLLYFADSVYYPAEYADQWKKILRNSGYGGTHGVYSSEAKTKMAKMVAEAPKYANGITPDFGPFVSGIEAEQTMPSAAGFEMSGVPSGLTWNALTGTLSGKAKKSGSFTVKLSNGTISQSMTVRVDPLSDEEPEPEPEPEPVETYGLVSEVTGAAPGAMSEYNGYLVDAAGNVKGTIQVKVGKPNAKTGIASVKGTVVPVGGKKTTIKANGNGKAKIETTGPTTLPFAGGEACSVTLGAKGMSGSYGAWTIDGVRNLLASKDKAEKASAEAAFAPLKTTLNIVWDGGVAALTVANKGKAKVKGTLATGGKLNASAQLLVGEKWACVPVAVAKSGLTFTVWISLGSGSRSYHVVGLGDDVAIGKAGSLPANAKFTIDPADATARWGAVLGAAYVKYLPDGMSVKPNGTKWEIAKAGKITMKKGVVDTSKARENPSGLKLMYKAKDGSFKGSFKIYAEVNGRLKATTVNVSGVMVGNAACGTATVKKLGSVGVTIE